MFILLFYGFSLWCVGTLHSRTSCWSYVQEHLLSLCVCVCVHVSVCACVWNKKFVTSESGTCFAIKPRDVVSDIPVESSSSVAPQASSSGFKSDIGLAVMMLPPKVCSDANQRHHQETGKWGTKGGWGGDYSCSWWYEITVTDYPKTEPTVSIQKKRVSNLVFYAKSTVTVIPGREKKSKTHKMLRLNTRMIASFTRPDQLNAYR